MNLRKPPQAPDPYTSDDLAAEYNPQYPDHVAALNGEPTQVLHYVQAVVLDGDAQFRKHAEKSRRTAGELAAQADALTRRAQLEQARLRRRRDETSQARRRLDAYLKVLEPRLPYKTKERRYWALFFLLVTMDIGLFASTLMNGAAGEVPMLAVIVAIGFGVAAAVIGLLSKDLRRWHLWLNLTEDQQADPILRRVYGQTKEGWMLARLVVAAGASAGLTAIITLAAIRMPESAPAVALAMGLMAGLTQAASWVNAWTHTDPASDAIHHAETTLAQAEKAEMEAPSEAISERAQLRRQAEETMRAGEDESWAVWHAHLSVAGRVMANNPALAGHHHLDAWVLRELRPTNEDLFDITWNENVIADETDEHTTTPPGEATADPTDGPGPDRRFFTTPPPVDGDDSDDADDGDPPPPPPNDGRDQADDDDRPEAA